MLYELFRECIEIPYSQVGVSANYAAYRKGQTLYIFFQSSKGKEDWQVNFNFPAKPYRRMGKTAWYAHRGFLGMWKEIEPALAPSRGDRDIKGVVITGYSLGGAIATL